MKNTRIGARLRQGHRNAVDSRRDSFTSNRTGFVQVGHAQVSRGTNAVVGPSIRTRRRGELGDGGRTQVPCRDDETASGHIADGVFVAFGRCGGDGVLTYLVQGLPNILKNFVCVSRAWTPNHRR